MQVTSQDNFSRDCLQAATPDENSEYPYLHTQTPEMVLYSASKRFDTPESSSEDLQIAALARILGETGTGLQKLYTSDPSTATSESHRATESSGIQHGYHDAGHQTDPTSVPSQVGDDNEFPSDKSDYGSSKDRLPGCDSRTNSDPIEDLRQTPPAEVLDVIGSHFQYKSELEEFQDPVNEEEGQAIEDRKAHTAGNCHQVIVDIRC